jgi:murein DD-endopeptidase MepM/ murein hydrolase activator NlpD/SH3-like domain-containing protein
MMARYLRLAPARLLACAILLTGCDAVEEVRQQFERKTPHEAYGDALRSAGLEATALVQEWSTAASLALTQPITVDVPFRETAYIAPERPTAVGYRLPVRRGQRVAIDVRLEGDSSTLLFLDVFRLPSDSLAGPSHMVSADSGGRSLEFEPRRDGDYLIRLQPELLRGGRYTLEIRSGPALSFPVQGGGNRNIQSGFGASRDAGARTHHGIDIFAPRGTAVLAAAEGVVSRVRDTPRGGKVVWLRDERRGASLYYAHLDRQLVSEGTLVKPGDTLGLVGNTGNARSTPPHLHFGIYLRGEGPIDPAPFVRQVATTPPELEIDPALIGSWTRVTRTEANLRASASARAPLVAELPRHTAMLVLAGTGEWYRVHLPDGRTGFVLARLLEDANQPVRRQVVDTPSPVWTDPSRTAVAIDSVGAGQPVDVLGRFGEFLYVQAAGGRTGWLAL